VIVLSQGLEADSILEVEGLRAGYGAISVLHGASLTVSRGETVAILGPNGAGKTTLLRTISCVVGKTAGRLVYNGRDLTGMDPHEVARIGLGHVPEGRAIFPTLTVSENLQLGSFGLAGRPDQGHDDRLEWILGLFPWMRDRLDQQGGTLSGGEQQMLAIGRALVGEPRLLLLDEPSLGLSPLMVGRVFEALTAIRERGVSIVLVEQSIGHALDVADRGYVMNRGEFVAAGDSERLRASSIYESYLGV
jgi:branched-chain amino acid transport system ATP-binding protein